MANWHSATRLTPVSALTSLIALTLLAVELCTMPLSDWAAIGQLSRLRRLELSPEKDVHLDAECRSAGIILLAFPMHRMLSLDEFAPPARTATWMEAKI